jgi:hypothetical protein
MSFFSYVFLALDVSRKENCARFAFGSARFAFGSARFAFGSARFAFGSARFAFGSARFAFGSARFALEASASQEKRDEGPDLPKIPTKASGRGVQHVP